MNYQGLSFAFKPLEIAAYLRTHGWNQVEMVPDKYSVWIKNDPPRGEFEVLLPLKSSFHDLDRRIRDLLTTLEIEEGRLAFQIIEDFSYTNADIIRTRLLSDSDSDGTLPLEKGAIAFQNLCDLILAAACAAIAPKQVFARRKPEQAMRYLQEARFGQTKPGSYIMTVISPVPPALQSSLLPDHADDPFPRKVVLTLAEALSTVTEGVQTAAISGNIDVFTHGVHHGVSVNLLDALLGLHLGSGEKGLDFSFSWSPTRRKPEHVKNQIILSPDAMPLLQEAASLLRKNLPEEDVEIVGVVKRLERREDDTGKVSIVGTVDGESRTVIMELHGPDHQLAIRAYENRLVMACRGELMKEGKSFVLRNPRGITIIEEDSTYPEETLYQSFKEQAAVACAEASSDYWWGEVATSTEKQPNRT